MIDSTIETEGPEVVEGKKHQLAALILEVLAGERTSSEAAQELGIGMPSYYSLEERAIKGLVEACGPRPRGPQKDPHKEILKLKEEIKRLESTARRTASLLRLSQRNLGVKPTEFIESEHTAASSKKKATKKSMKKRKAKKTKARALVKAKKLRAEKINSVESNNDHGDNFEEVQRVS